MRCRLGDRTNLLPTFLSNLYTKYGWSIRHSHVSRREVLSVQL